MAQHQQSVFYLEWIQSDWLPTKMQKGVFKRGAALLSGLVFGLVGGLVYGPGGSVIGLRIGLVGGLVGRLVGGLLLGLIKGGSACFRHFNLRILLWRNGSAPWRYVRFLDYAAERVFLRKDGGGYIFVHRMLLEYFAALHPSHHASPGQAPVSE